MDSRLGSTVCFLEIYDYLGDEAMIYFPVIFLCVMGLFLTLLQDRYRIWTTVGVMLGAYVLAVVASGLISGVVQGKLLPQHAGCAAGMAFFLLASIFMHTNNLLQKGFVAMLCMSNFAYSQLLLPLLLGVMPFKVSGVAGGITILVTLLINLCMGLCLYRPMQKFSQRGPSAFLFGMLGLIVFEYLLCVGRLGLLIIVPTPFHLLLLATTVYAVLIFSFRSVYQAGRWQSEQAHAAARRHMLDMESVDFMDMLCAVREVRSAQKAGEYALDTIDQLIREDQAEKIPVYIRMSKHNTQHNPILFRYHSNPYLNAVIATKAALAAQNDIEFECNLSEVEAPLKTSELCVLVNEMLSRGCIDAAKYEGKRRLRFTAIPGEDTLRLEAVYTGELPEEKRFSPKGKKLSDLLEWLFDDSPGRETQLRGLDNTAEIALAYSGSLTVSGTEQEIVVRAQLRF